MNIKKIFFALIVTALLIGSACAANMNDFKVDGYKSSYNNDFESEYVNNNGDSGISIYKNIDGAHYDDDGYFDHDDAYDNDYDDAYDRDYDDIYDHDYDDAYDNDYDDAYDHDYDDIYDNDYDGIRDDMQLSKNSDNTATFKDYDDAEHGVVEVVNVGGQQYTVVVWAKDSSNLDNGDLMSKLTDFNKDNKVAPVAF